MLLDGVCTLLIEAWQAQRTADARVLHVFVLILWEVRGWGPCQLAVPCISQTGVHVPMPIQALLIDSARSCCWQVGWCACLCFDCAMAACMYAWMGRPSWTSWVDVLVCDSDSVCGWVRGFGTYICIQWSQHESECQAPSEIW